MKKTRLLAKRLLFGSGLALMIWPAWELSVRMDAMAGPLGMFWRMAVGEGIPLARVWSYIDWSIFATPAFLLQCALLGLFTFGLRGRGYGCLWLAPVALLLGLHGLWRREFFSLAPVRIAEALPFAGVLLGCGAHLAANIAQRRQERIAPRQHPKAFPLKGGPAGR